MDKSQRRERRKAPRHYKEGFNNEELREAYAASERRVESEGTLERDFGNPDRFDPSVGSVMTFVNMRTITHTDTQGREYQLSDPSVHQIRKAGERIIFSGMNLVLNMRIPKGVNSYARLSQPGQEPLDFPMPNEVITLTLTDEGRAIGLIPNMSVRVNEREENSEKAASCSLHCIVLRADN